MNRKDIFNAKLAKLLTHYRTKRDFTLEIAARQMGFADKTVLSKIEGGKRVVTAYELVRFIRVYEIHFFDLSTILLGR